jgi:hypothetical protein
MVCCDLRLVDKERLSANENGNRMRNDGENHNKYAAVTPFSVLKPSQTKKLKEHRHTGAFFAVQQCKKQWRNRMHRMHSLHNAKTRGVNKPTWNQRQGYLAFWKNNRKNTHTHTHTHTQQSYTQQSELLFFNIRCAVQSRQKYLSLNGFHITRSYTRSIASLHLCRLWTRRRPREAGGAFVLMNPVSLSNSASVKSQCCTFFGATNPNGDSRTWPMTDPR